MSDGSKQPPAQAVEPKRKKVSLAANLKMKMGGPPPRTRRDLSSGK